MSECDVLLRRACRVAVVCGGALGLAGVAAGGESIQAVPLSWSGTVTMTTTGTSGAQPTGCDTSLTIPWVDQTLDLGTERTIAEGTGTTFLPDFSCTADLGWRVEMGPINGSLTASARTFDIDALASVTVDATTLWASTEWARSGMIGGRVTVTGVLTASAKASVLWELNGPIAPDGRVLDVYSYASPVEFDEPVGVITVDGVSLTEGLAPGRYELRLTLAASEESPFVPFASGVGVAYEVQRSVPGIVTAVPLCDGSGPCGDVNGDGQTTFADIEDWVLAPVDTTGDGTADADPLGDDAAFLVAQLLALGAIDPTDCDANGYPDEYDIAAGLATDFNGNGVPDSCDPPKPCNAADVAQPFFVLDIDDVLTYLFAFNDGDLAIADLAGCEFEPRPGRGGGDPCDVPGGPDGMLDIDDVLTFLAAFDAGCGGN